MKKIPKIGDLLLFKDGVIGIIIKDSSEFAEAIIGKDCKERKYFVAWSDTGYSLDFRSGAATFEDVPTEYPWSKVRNFWVFAGLVFNSSTECFQLSSTDANSVARSNLDK